MSARMLILFCCLCLAACATPPTAEQIEAQREEILAANPDWPGEVVAEIRRGRVALGMSREQVLAALGPPLVYPPVYPVTHPSISSPVIGSSDLGWQLAQAESARWTYGRGDEALYVSFCDGEVCRISDPASGRFERSR